MSKTRVSKKVVANVSNQDMESALALYANADAQLAKINAEMDVQFTRIREKNESQIQLLESEKTLNFEIVQTWALENATAFEKRKSKETSHGLIGFRTGTPKLKLLKGFKLADVIGKLKQLLPEYVRMVEEPMKDRLIADRNIDEVVKNLPKVGYEVVQEESFYIDLKKE